MWAPSGSWTDNKGFPFFSLIINFLKIFSDLTFLMSAVRFFHSFKNHICEEGGAHLRISFWHLLMNFEKPKKSEFWKNETTFFWRYHFTPCVPKTTIIWGTVLEIQSETKFFWHFGSFFALYPPTPLPPTLITQKTKILKKWKKHLKMSSF